MRQTKRYFAIGLVALLVLGFLTTSVVSYFVAQQSVRERIAEESLPLTSDNIYSEIERDLLRSILISSLMAHDTFVRDWVRGGERQPERIIRYLEQIQEKYETTTAFFVSENTRRYYHPTGVIKTVDSTDPADAWYFRVREMNDPYEINIDLDTADRSRMSIFINYRVTDESGNFLGVTGIGLAVNVVANLIETYQKRYGREIYFIDREGEVTLRGSGYEGPGNIHERPGLDKHATRLLTSPSTSLRFERPDGETVYLNSRIVPEFGWYLVVQQTETAAESRVLNTLVFNIALALAITSLVLGIGYFTLRGYQRQLEQMATTDKLTGAANRHVFEMIFRHVTETAKRRGEPVSAISLDIDGFKAVNDTHGHQVGDMVLQRVARAVRSNLRESDTLCRYGGDEFIILLGGCSAEEGGRIAEKLRDAVKAESFQVGDEAFSISASLGVVELREEESLGTVVRRADQALYEAKRNGRDRVSGA